jgi:hypothetical protein
MVRTGLFVWLVGIDLGSLKQLGKHRAARLPASHTKNGTVQMVCGTLPNTLLLLTEIKGNDEAMQRNSLQDLHAMVLNHIKQYWHMEVDGATYIVGI